jgi:hypothetical protein
MPRFNQKGFSHLIIIGIIAVLFIGGIIYFRNTSNSNNPSPQSISNVSTAQNSLEDAKWKYLSHQDLDLGYEIEYPLSWIPIGDN